MLQQDEAKDYVLATNETHTVREFVELSFKHVGIDIIWKGIAENEVGINKESGAILVEINSRYYRPTEVDLLLGDASMAKKELGWEPKVKFNDLVSIMVEADWKKVKEQGF